MGHRGEGRFRGRCKVKPLDFPMSFALLASTYGWSHREILSLSSRQFFMYLRQAFKLSSLKQLKDFESASFPYLKERDRRDLFNRYSSHSNSYRADKKSIEDSWNLLRSGGGKNGRRGHFRKHKT